MFWLYLLGTSRKYSFQVKHNGDLESTEQYQCEFCSWKFNSSEALLLHLSEHDNRDGKWWVLIFSQTKLIVHFVVLSDFIFDEEKFEFLNECHICSKDFADSTSLLLHLGEHGISYDSMYWLKFIFTFLLPHKSYFILYVLIIP